MRLRPRHPLLAVAVAVAIAGCGDSGETVTVTKTVTEPVARQAAPEPAAKPRKARQFKNCDANIRARKRTTSCPFAQNVFYEFWKATQAGDDAVSAYSPVTGRQYDLSCDAGIKVVCKAGDGSDVRFAMAAIDAYDAEQAVAYCESHDLGDASAECGDDDDLQQLSSGDTGGETSDACDPNYEGACLDPASPDYDCDGGSGDGPDYTGYVTVVGDDPYDLDRDGDGTACE